MKLFEPSTIRCFRVGNHVVDDSLMDVAMFALVDTCLIVRVCFCKQFMHMNTNWSSCKGHSISCSLQLVGRGRSADPANRVTNTHAHDVLICIQLLSLDCNCVNLCDNMPWRHCFVLRTLILSLLIATSQTSANVSQHNMIILHIPHGKNYL